MANEMEQLDAAEISSQGSTSETTDNGGRMEKEPSPLKTKGKQEKGSSANSTKNQEESVEFKKSSTFNAGDDDPNAKIQGKRNGEDRGMDTYDISGSGTQVQDGGGGKGKDADDVDEKGSKRERGEARKTVGDVISRNKTQGQNGEGGNGEDKVDKKTEESKQEQGERGDVEREDPQEGGGGNVQGTNHKDMEISKREQGEGGNSQTNSTGENIKRVQEGGEGIMRDLRTRMWMSQNKIKGIRRIWTETKMERMEQ